MAVKKPPNKKARTTLQQATIGQLTSNIKNKQARSDVYAKLKVVKKKEKKAARERSKKEDSKAAELGLEPPRKIPRTIENTREKDETLVNPDDEEVLADEADDEFAAGEGFADYFRRERDPRVLITTNYKPSGIMYAFIADLLDVLPDATYYKRQGFPLQKIAKYAANREFTDLMVFNEDRKSINGLLLIHLPDGPTAHFKLSNLVLSKDIRGHGRAGEFKAELILKNFHTLMGRRVGRMFASLFAQDPHFKGRQVATLHNQRDYIFFRHHRYVFEEKERRSQNSMVARLQELGPRFTLKLRSLQKGTFDSKAGEYEWIRKSDQDTSRRKFVL